jgi:hypothetical protein
LDSWLITVDITVPPAPNKMIDYTPDWHYRVWSYTKTGYEEVTCDVPGSEDHIWICMGGYRITADGITGEWEVRENAPQFFADGYNFYDADMNLLAKSTDLITNGPEPAGWYLERGRYKIVYKGAKIPVTWDWTKVAFVRPVTDGKESTLTTRCPPYVATPIAVDADGSGAIERAGHPVNFDLNTDGTAERLDNWFASGDGILVDLKSGAPLDGTALFGDQGGTYANGYAKLATRDANRDGRISGRELAGLGLWFDDGDAVAQPGEIRTAARAGLTSISTRHTNLHSTARLRGHTVATEDVLFGTSG